MKKWFAGCTTLLAVLFLLPMMGIAEEGTPPPAPPQPPTKAPAPATPPAPAARPAVPQAAPAAAANGTKYLKITVVSANLWPAKPSGKCWDPCFMKKFKLPPRGNKNYVENFSKLEFAQACSKAKAPDGLVEIKIGKYGLFTTDKINNQCQPKFNVSHTFRVTPDMPFSVGVYDNDGGAGFQVKRDEMGIYTAGKIPAELMNGGTLTLRNFGQVEELVLKGELVSKPVSAGCDGVYKVRIAEYEVEATKSTGASWDRGFGGFKKPDVMLKLKIGSEVLETPKKQDTLAYNFNKEKIEKVLTLKKGTTVSLSVFDKDGFGKMETIGDTAESDVCKLVSKGEYTFSNFGRVKKVVLIFTKQK